MASTIKKILAFFTELINLKDALMNPFAGGAVYLVP
jgi:hypothetical protein